MGNESTRLQNTVSQNWRKETLDECLRLMKDDSISDTARFAALGQIILSASTLTMSQRYPAVELFQCGVIGDGLAVYSDEHDEVKPAVFDLNDCGKECTDDFRLENGSLPDIHGNMTVTPEGAAGYLLDNGVVSPREQATVVEMGTVKTPKVGAPVNSSVRKSPMFASKAPSAKPVGPSV